VETLPAPALRRPRLTLSLLRAVLTVHLLAVLAQPVLAGRYLTGDVGAIGWHATIGSALAAVALVVVAAALGYVLVRRGSWWLLAVAVLLFLADGVQIGMGYDRVLEIHIPLGVAIVVGSVLLAAWAWSPSAARAGRAR
jgi:hypothetical protein